MKRRHQRHAKRIRAANAASRWGGPDFTTPIRGVAKSGPDDLRFEGNRTNNNNQPENGATAADAPTPSTNRAALTTSPAFRGESRPPALYLWPKPELDPPITELTHWTWHIAVTVLVNAHRVAVGETKKLRDSVCVKEIVDVHLATHYARLLQ
jgi:hypothetical protein